MTEAAFTLHNFIFHHDGDLVNNDKDAEDDSD